MNAIFSLKKELALLSPSQISLLSQHYNITAPQGADLLWLIAISLWNKSVNQSAQMYQYIITDTTPDRIKELIHAINNENEEIVSFLVSIPEKRLYVEHGFFPLHYAVEKSKLASITTLSEWDDGIFVNPLDADERRRRDSKIKEKQDYIDSIKSKKDTMITKESTEYVKKSLKELEQEYLLDYSRDNDGRTALMYANSPEIVDILVKAGANINAQDKYGKTAIMIAVEENKNRKVILRLLNNGADVSIMDADQNTVFDYAVKNYMILRMLVHLRGKKDVAVKQANINYQDPVTGKTLLMFSVEIVDSITVEWLLNHKINLSLEDSDSYTIEDYIITVIDYYYDNEYRGTSNEKRILVAMEISRILKKFLGILELSLGVKKHLFFAADFMYFDYSML